MPDDELLTLAASNRLHDETQLRDQARRMLLDDRVEGFANAFAGDWLDIRRFDQHNGVDRGRFPEFGDELRQAMHDEPIRFFRDLIERDGSVLDFLYADHTFVNPVLSKHYGMSDASTERLAW